ncbi:hypothetical protein N3K66_003716 [Trichothecium roseum]|uniref:Uncharacterized protein n=1 Tax=Trichothecium roseum TaxID=47278 RepID=A0ACC0V6D3_9HYPO|nr:hypothetical protein N3K66_003716 [Trichothecium roseum]
MDFLKKVVNHQSSTSSSGKKDDLVDKVFAVGAQKSGFRISKDNQEKITDFGRTTYEKATGKKVHPKISN